MKSRLHTLQMRRLDALLSFSINLYFVLNQKKIFKF